MLNVYCYRKKNKGRKKERKKKETEARFQVKYSDFIQELLNIKLVNTCKVIMQIRSRNLKCLVIVIQQSNGRFYALDTGRNRKSTLLSLLVI